MDFPLIFWTVSCNFRGIFFFFFLLDLEDALTQQAWIEVTLTFFAPQDWYTLQKEIFPCNSLMPTKPFHVLKWNKGAPNFWTMAKKNGHCVELKWFWLYAWPIFSLLLPAQVIIYESYSFFRHFNEILHKIAIFICIFPLQVIFITLIPSLLSVKTLLKVLFFMNTYDISVGIFLFYVWVLSRL